MNHGLETVAAIVAGILTVAIVAVIVGKNAQTSSVVQAFGTALSGTIAAAVAPVSGSTNQFGQSN